MPTKPSGSHRCGWHCVELMAPAPQGPQRQGPGRPAKPHQQLDLRLHPYPAGGRHFYTPGPQVQHPAQSGTHEGNGQPSPAGTAACGLCRRRRVGGPGALPCPRQQGAAQAQQGGHSGGHRPGSSLAGPVASRPQHASGGKATVAAASSTRLVQASCTRAAVVSCAIWARPRQASSASRAASAIAAGVVTRVGLAAEGKRHRLRAGVACQVVGADHVAHRDRQSKPIKGRRTTSSAPQPSMARGPCKACSAQHLSQKKGSNPLPSGCDPSHSRLQPGLWPCASACM